MRHRHLDYDDVAIAERGLAALDDLLDRGDFTAWRPLAQAIAADPFGPLADRVAYLCDVHPMQGTSSLWRAWIAARRARAAGRSERAPAATLRELRQHRGLTQEQVAGTIGMSQSDLSKVERRHDLKLSTLRAVIGGMGLDLRLIAVDPDTGDTRELELADGDRDDD